MNSSKYALIQYPGVVKNVDRALVTLGGVAKISQDYFKSQTLLIDYHGENFYSKPAPARRREGIFLIIHARRKKLKPEDASTSKCENLEVKILGFSTALHHFNVIFDYQYLPVKRVFKTDEHENRPSTAAKDETVERRGAQDNEEEAVFENLSSKLFPQTIEESLTWLDENTARENDVDLFLPPPAFSKYFASVPFMLCRDIERKMPVPKNLPMGSRVRAPRKTIGISVQALDKFPTAPINEAVKRCQPYLQNLPNLVNKVVEAYEERPIWTRNALFYRTQLSEFLIRELAPAYAFYITSGPFGRCWCKFGYDPRKDSNSRRYQPIIFTERSPAFSRIPRKQATNTMSKQLANIRPLGLKEMNIYPESLAYYMPGEKPLFRQMFYHLCDIKLPVTEEILRTPPPADCSPSTGWLTEGQIEAVRAAIKKEVGEKMDQLEPWYSNDEED